MRQRVLTVGAILVLAAWIGAGLVTVPDLGAGMWLDYVVPPLTVAVAAIALTRPGLADAWLGTVARIMVGGIWVYAGAIKLPDPAGSIEAVRAYDLLPQSLVEPIGYLLPPLEVVLGAALIIGVMTRGAAFLSALLLLAFIIGISAAWARGLEINCGCFGDGGANVDASLQYPWEISRDVALLALSLALLGLHRTRLALDSVLFRSRLSLDDFIEDDDHDGADASTRHEGTSA
ncbi:hypothetical protein BH11ACT8_BH11ACT8_16110 [soil metagenome]